MHDETNGHSRDVQDAIRHLACSAAAAHTAEAVLPTRWGKFRAVAFRSTADDEILALVWGEVANGAVPLVRLHSECLTGDTLGSLRCDCGEQLERALAAIAAAESGVLVYLPQEGRGIGLLNKIRAYALQDAGLDTVEANAALGLPVDAREYASAAAVLRHLGIRQVRLLTNNPAKCQALEQYGITVLERVPVRIAPNSVNAQYLRTKAERMGHQLELQPRAQEDVPRQAGRARPGVTIHYAQTLDGRIATRTGNSQWISGNATLHYAHALRASHQAIMVGVGTVLADNPRLTVRHVPGPSPRRIVLDSTLRIPLDANVLTDTAVPTVIATTARATQSRIEAARARGADVLVLEPDTAGRVDLRRLLEQLYLLGVRSVLIEGGAGVITSALQAQVVDRFTACIAPKVVGAGIEAVGELNILRLSDALTFTRSSFTPVGDDIVFEGWVDHGAGATRDVAAAAVA